MAYALNFQKVIMSSKVIIVDVMISPGSNTFPCNVSQQIMAHFKHYQIKTHVETASESHYLNMDFRSFDNVFKQLCVTNFKQE